MVTGCSYFDTGVCRSCTLLDLPYPAQLQRKLEVLKETLRSCAGLPAPKPVVPSDSLLASRNKAKMAVAGGSETVILGFTKAGGSTIEIGGCPLHVPPLPRVLERVREAVRQHGLEPYDIASRRGELKFVIARAAEYSGEVLLRLVLRSKAQLNEARAVLKDVAAEEPAVVVYSVNLQPVHQAIIEGPEELLLSEREYLHDRLGAFTIAVAPQSFSQVTSNIAVKLYEHVAAKIAAVAPQSLLDLFCGNGAFSLFCSDAVRSGAGVEISEAAVRSARKTFELNGRSNFSFHVADAGTYIRQHGGFDAVIVNPPRRGIGDDIIDSLLRQRPPLLIYSSCHPRTLASDLSRLLNAYEVIELQPFDMFPGTEHVEVVAELRLR